MNGIKALSLVVGLISMQSGAWSAPIDFEREVRPIFERHCVACHGPTQQKSGLRLDRRADAHQGGDGGKVLDLEHPTDSELLRRVTTPNVTERMPPEKAALSAEDLGVLRRWLEQGATWPDDGSRSEDPASWWSFRPIAATSLPVTPASIDRLIRDQLPAKGLTPAPTADRRTLIRRLYFDLIGLPPTPAAASQFVNDPDGRAYERLVDELLASPHYGERWARHWLDVVHFGETHGYDKDKPRPNAWPYRDYVIRSFNADKPYRQFIAEQIAGDVLAPETADGIEALGFLAAGPWDYIGHSEVPETKIDGKIARHLDRDDVVANTIGTFMGLTVHCAQCHQHKFDPITQADYYRLHAVFAAIDRTERQYDPNPATARQWSELDRQRRTAAEQIRRLEATAQEKVGDQLTAFDEKVTALRKAANEKRPTAFGYHSKIASTAEVVKWVQVDLEESVPLTRVVVRPCYDDFNKIGAGFGFPPRFQIAISDDEEFASSTIVLDATADDVPNPGLAPTVVEIDGRSARYVRFTAAKLAPRSKDYILALAELEAYDADGKNRARGKPVESLDTTIAPPRWRELNLTDGQYSVDEKSSETQIAGLQPLRDALIRQALGDEQYAVLETQRREVHRLEAELAKRKESLRTVFVGSVHTGKGNFAGTGSDGGKPRAIHLLARGDVTKPGKEVTPGAIAAVPAGNANFDLSADHSEGQRRAALAEWITNPSNPLTWRVMANRIWQHHFGRGIVATPNDFGKMGALPSQPLLLDFLAGQLRDQQSLKLLHRLIVLSQTYQQSSANQPGLAVIDADNQHLWRQHRRKLEAEAVRDAILFVADKLDRTMGGPSFQDFIIEKPEHSPHYQYHLHDPDDPKSHRRAIYRFVVRSKQQPFMAALDCADPSLSVDRRNQTQTPQQALALLNDGLAIVMARHFAARVQALGATDAERIDAAFQIALQRLPTVEERATLVQHVQQHGLTNVCRLIFNLNEFVFVD